MAQNSFEDLQLENEARFEKSSKGIKQNVSSRRNLWSFIGDLFELYIPQLFGAIINSKSITSNNISNGEKEE